MPNMWLLHVSMVFLAFSHISSPCFAFLSWFLNLTQTIFIIICKNHCQIPICVIFVANSLIYEYSMYLWFWYNFDVNVLRQEKTSQCDLQIYWKLTDFLYVWKLRLTWCNCAKIVVFAIFFWLLTVSHYFLTPMLPKSIYQLVMNYMYFWCMWKFCG